MNGVSRETKSKLSAYVDLLQHWQNSINLIGSATIDEIEQRHIVDSLQLLQYLPTRCRLIIDMGSGAGFPGLVLAIASDSKVILIEADQRKSVFLNTVRRKLRLDNVEVINTRIEAAGSLKADCITARALAPLDKLLEYTRMVSAGSAVRCLFHKGRLWKSEVADLGRTIPKTALESHPSQTDPDAAILQIDLNGSD